MNGILHGKGASRKNRRENKYEKRSKPRDKIYNSVNSIIQPKENKNRKHKKHIIIFKTKKS